MTPGCSGHHYRSGDDGVSDICDRNVSENDRISICGDERSGRCLRPPKVFCRMLGVSDSRASNATIDGRFVEGQISGFAVARTRVENFRMSWHTARLNNFIVRPSARTRPRPRQGQASMPTPIAFALFRVGCECRSPSSPTDVPIRGLLASRVP